METSSSDGASMESEPPPSPSNVEGPDGYLRSRTMRFIHSPILTLLEYSGVLRFRPDHSFSDSEPLIPEIVRNPRSGSSNSGGEVSIRIIDPDNNSASAAGEGGNHGAGSGAEEPTVGGGDGVNENGRGSSGGGDNTNANTNMNTNNTTNNNREGSSYQRYDIQGAARWIEQILPFSLLLLIVFIRQHLQGFVVTIYSTLVLFKTNDTIQKQTALKGERKVAVLVGYSIFLVLNISGIYSWKWGDDLCYPLLMIPPNGIPPFWHAVFIIVVNDIMARQTAMFLKLILLMYYKNGKGHNFRRQGQLLTLVEYTLLLYRALLPTPVWYRFFLNKEYGSLFSSLTTGLYLTFKLTSIIEKVQSFFYALKALTRKEIHYGSHATPEQINVAGDLCAICQEKMQTPIFLRCKHVFCEDCVSEWFERERTCPLCRSLVRAADLKSYADGSTSLYFQLF